MTLAEKAFQIYQDHGYGGQTWSTNEGYTVRCSCGKAEFTIGQGPSFEEPVKPNRLIELQAKDELDPKEQVELDKLWKAWTSARTQVLDAHTKEINKFLNAPISAHVMSLFEALLVQP